LEVPFSADEVEVSANTTKSPEVFLIDAPIPPTWIPALAVTQVVQKFIPRSETALGFKEEHPGK
jgi:hypothetical protein